ncbi:hypothetical protein D3C86_1741640 [compost metagenome]
MKGLLIGFFQVLCFLHVFGHSQLNTYPTDKPSPSSFIHFHHSTQKHSHVAPLHQASHAAFNSNTSVPVEDTELIFENIEEETEDFSSGKHLYNSLYFAGTPVDQSLDYLYGSTKNSSRSCEQLSFLSANRRHVVFQVFRI